MGRIEPGLIMSDGNTNPIVCAWTVKVGFTAAGKIAAGVSYLQESQTSTIWDVI